MGNLQSKQTKLKSDLENVNDQIKATNMTSEEQIASLESSLNKITAERDKLRKEYSDLQTKMEWENRKLKGELETATSGSQERDNELLKLKNENEELNKKLTWIRKTKTEADAEIKKLTNQVNLLKKQLKWYTYFLD